MPPLRLIKSRSGSSSEALPLDQLYGDRAIKERIGALVVPISSRGCFKMSEGVAVKPWHARRIEKHNFFAADRIGQRTKQR